MDTRNAWRAAKTEGVAVPAEGRTTGMARTFRLVTQRIHMST